MIVIFHILFLTTLTELVITASSITPSRSLSRIGIRRYRGIDEALRDRNWERYLHQLRRLKLPEMKKAIRSRVLSEKFYPYFSLKHITRRLELLKLYDPDNTEVGYVKNSMRGNSMYRTLSGQGILYVKISEADEENRDASKKNEKLVRPIIVLVAGIGGRDWTTVHAIIHVITYLVTSFNREKLAGFDWWIIPVLNPDGYINSFDNKMSRNYSPNINPGNGCWGVNLDRNFLFQRAACRDGEEVYKCRENSGEYPFSEIESRALRDFIYAHADKCKLFVALKEGTKALVYPFSSTSTRNSGTHTTLQDLLCMEALEVFDQFHRGRKNLFRFGNSGSVFGPSSGYVEDWARRHLGIPRSFAFYIAYRGEQEREPVERIGEYGKATLNSIKVLATSRRIESFRESLEELINQTSVSRSLEHRRAKTIPWGKELIDENLRDKIIRGARLEMPIELTSSVIESRYDTLDCTILPE